VLGTADSGDIGAQGDSPAPGALLPVTLPTMLPAGAETLTGTTSSGGDTAKLDAVMLEPAVSRLVLAGDGHGTALLSSASDRTERSVVRLEGSGPATVETYDDRGNLVSSHVTPSRAVNVAVPAGGFALVTR
jgi:hypothetical protein